jgi:hypothetical protein
VSRADERLDRLVDLLAAEGIAGARVSSAGQDNDVAVIAGVEPQRLAMLAPVIRRLGFRFVTWDLTRLSP